MNSLAGIDMGRILLNLSNELFKQLDDLEVQRNLPRAELLREAGRSIPGKSIANSKSQCFWHLARE